MNRSLANGGGAILKNKGGCEKPPLILDQVRSDQYIPPKSPPAGAAGAGGVGISVTMLSVVSRVAATEAAF